MIEVVLDTNIYSSDPLRRTARFNALLRLAKSGKLHLHIPYLVQKEFLSQQTEHYEQLVSSVGNSIIELQRKVSPNLVKKLDGIKDSFSKIQDDLISFPTIEFNKWINEVNGVVHSISELHGVQVIEDYFEGAPPFKNKKSRLDIPDSFIWQVISDLANQFDVLYVVANDKKVREACGIKQNIMTFESLDDFIQSDVCRSTLEEEKVKENIERLFKYASVIFAIRQDEIREQLTKALENATIQSEVLITNNSHYATIKYITDYEQDITIGRSALAQYYGNGMIVIPFNTQTKITAEYGLSSAEYHHLGLKRTEQIFYSELDEIAEESFTLDVGGKISISVDSQKILEPNLSEEDIKTLMDNSELNIDSIDQTELSVNLKE